MKTYEEMTQSVLEKAKEQRTARRRRIATGVTVAAFLCVLCAGALLGIVKDQPQEPAMQTPGLVLMCSATEYAEPKEMLKGVKAPAEYRIYVRDLRDLNLSEYEHQLIMAEERTKWRIAESEADDVFGGNSITQWGDEDGVITIVRDGFLYIKVEDISQIQEMSATTTGISQASLGQIHYRQQTEIGEEEIKEGISIYLSLSEETVNKIMGNPDVDLSFISDRLTVRVAFTDGTVECMVMDISVDREGTVYVTPVESP